jgi:hypothetical protein
MSKKATLCVVVGSLLLANTVAAQWRAYPGPKRPKKELVKIEKENGIRLISVNGSQPTGPLRELPAEHPVWPSIYCPPGQTTVRLAIECLECRSQIGSTVEAFEVKTEAVELQFEMELGKKYLLAWSWSKHRGVIPTAEVRIWVEVDRPTFGLNPRGQKILEQSVTVPLIEKQE